MTEDEYTQLRTTLNRIAEHQKRLTAYAGAPEDSFTPVVKGILDLLAAAKKRISDRIGGQPPLNE